MAVLRYSPRNSLVVDWPFDTCGLPDPIPVAEDEASEPYCEPKPIVIRPDTYDWARFLPEVMVGIEDPDPDIAANYVRQAAIEFARDGHVLQRELVLDFEEDEDTYPVPSFPGERVAGILSVRLDDSIDECTCSGLRGRTVLGFSWEFDPVRNEVKFFGQPCKGRVYLRLWAAPTEDACEYDVALYDNHRAAITVGARRAYVLAAHFRDRMLVATLPSFAEWNMVIMAALRQAHRVPTARKQAVSATWARGAGGWHPDGYRRRY